MIQKSKNQNISYKAFTLVEMVIVLIIMWIMLMFTVSLSGDQIQKVKNKAVKESILAEMQTRYSRNLWSSSFAWKMYNTMDVKLINWANKIDFTYNVKNHNEEKVENIENSFMNHFEIKYLTTNYEVWKEWERWNEIEGITLHYSPYKISCTIWWDDEGIQNLVIVTRINDNKDYCFEIKQKNCRLTEISEDICNTLQPGPEK